MRRTVIRKSEGEGKEEGSTGQGVAADVVVVVEIAMIVITRIAAALDQDPDHLQGERSVDVIVLAGRL